MRQHLARLALTLVVLLGASVEASRAASGTAPGTVAHAAPGAARSVAAAPDGAPLRPAAAASCLTLTPLGQAGGQLGAVALGERVAYAGVGPRVLRLEPGRDGTGRLEATAVTAPLDGTVQAVGWDSDRGLLYAAIVSGSAGKIVVLQPVEAEFQNVGTAPLDFRPTALVLAVDVGGARTLAVTGDCDCVLFADVAGGLPAMDTALRVEDMEYAAIDGADDYVAIVGQTLEPPIRPALAIWTAEDGLVRVPLDAEDFNPWEGLTADGDLVYLRGGDYAVDVTDRGQPVVRTALTFPVPSDVASGTWFVGSDESVVALDGRDADDLGFLGAVDAGVGRLVTDVVASGTAVAAIGEGISLIDASSPADLKLVGTWASPGSVGTIAADHAAAYSATDRIWAFGSRAFRGTGAVFASAYVPPEISGLVYGGDYALDVSGRLAALGDRTGSRSQLMLLALGQTDGPMVLGTWAPLPEFRDIVMDGLYVYGLSTLGLHVLDASDVTRPYPVGSLDRPPESGRRLDVWDGLAAIAGDGLVLVDTSDPANPSVLADIPGQYSDAALAGGILWATREGESPALVGYDVSEPANPRLAGSHPLERALAVEAAGAWVAVADGTTLRVFDASDPSELQPVGTADLPSAATDLDSTGRYLFAATGAGGIFSFSVACDPLFVPYAMKRVAWPP
jgi:hypothetical protein